MLCNNCFILITVESTKAYFTIIKCKECRRIILKSLRNQNQSYPISDSDPKKIENSDKNPSYCKKFSDNKVSPYISPSSASPENSRLQNNMKCDFCYIKRTCVNLQCRHSYCTSCIKFRNDKLNWNQCGDCKAMNEHSCRKCFVIIEDMNSRIFNPSCEKKHFYCSNCFIDKSSLQDSEYCLYCKKLYYGTYSELCIFCNMSTGNNMDNLCPKHGFCQNCCQLINIQNIKAYLSIVRCENCKIKIQQMMQIKPTSNIEFFNNNAITNQRANRHSCDSFNSTDQMMLVNDPNYRSNRYSYQAPSNYLQNYESAMFNPISQANYPNTISNANLGSMNLQMNFPQNSNANLGSMNLQMGFSQNNLPVNNMSYNYQEYNQAGHNNPHNTMPPIYLVEENLLNNQNSGYSNLPQYSFPQTKNNTQNARRSASNRCNYHGVACELMECGHAFC